MNSFFAAGLFENPWIVAVIVIVGALANWLSKRRQEQQAEKSPEGEEPPPSSDKPAREFNLEEAMRRLLGEEPPAPPPVPPPIPPAARGESPPATAWHEEGPLVKQTAAPLRPPPLAPARADIAAVGEQQRRAARRFEQLTEQGRHPATVVGHGRGSRSRPGKRAAAPWRDPRSARRAFVASLVFGPPKGLEP